MLRTTFAQATIECMKPSSHQYNSGMLAERSEVTSQLRWICTVAQQNATDTVVRVVVFAHRKEALRLSLAWSVMDKNSATVFFCCNQLAKLMAVGCR